MDGPPDQRGLQAHPLNKINWTLARGEIGLKVSVLVEEIAKVLQQLARDAIPFQLREAGRRTKKSSLLPRETR